MLPNIPRVRWLVVSACALAAAPALAQTPVGTAFTYQGRLTDASVPANGAYDLQFVLYTASTGGSQVGSVVTRDDVAVTNGLFAVSLDFGAAAFTGDARWLEVGARPGGSTGAFVVLSPRQELTPSPNAVLSQKTPWTGITGIPSGFADGTDDDVLGGLSCAGGQVAKWNGTAWACAADAVGSGTVTSVATGAGLTGGPITLTGTVSVATGGITTSLLASGSVTSAKIASGAVGSAQIAGGAVGSAQINAAQVQVRISGACAMGQYFRGVNSDGTVLCEPVPGVPSVTTVATDVSGLLSYLYTSIAIGADGLPVISYADYDGGTLKVAHCGNAACTSGNTIMTVDIPTNSVGRWTSIAIGTDSLPVISYQDVTASALKVAHCGNAACTSGNTIRTVDNPANSVGEYTSIAIGTDGLPVISYYDSTARALKVAHCGNATCSSGNSMTPVDTTDDVGEWTSIAIGTDGMPVISYYDSTAGALKVAHCSNAGCTMGTTITTVDDPAANDVGWCTSIAIGTDGLPVISYYDSTAFALKVAHCGNATCAAGNTITTVYNPTNNVGALNSIAIGIDGLPVISFFDSTAGSLKVAHCGNPACSMGTSITTVDNASDVGQCSSIAIGIDGLPVISYQTEGVSIALKVAKCGTRSCQ